MLTNNLLIRFLYNKMRSIYSVGNVSVYKCLFAGELELASLNENAIKISKIYEIQRLRQSSRLILVFGNV